MSTAAVSPRAIGVFGGTFNPVHYGHLRSALELAERLELSDLRLMPCAVPPHREEPGCSAEHRANMVELAVAGEPSLSCDRRELSRPGKSYTFDSLQSLRSELGSHQPLCLVMGFDALLGIPGWYRWQELLNLAHIVVIARPGWELPASGDVADWLQAHWQKEGGPLTERPHGTVRVEILRPLAISSTEIRELCSGGRSTRYLVPDPVLNYMREHSLYQSQRRCTE